MVIERRWKKWVYFYIPLTLFVIGTLFPFYWMFVTAIRPDAPPVRPVVELGGAACGPGPSPRWPWLFALAFVPVGTIRGEADPDAPPEEPAAGQGFP